MKRMPILNSDKSIPFCFLDEAWAQIIHRQSLDELKKRGGMTASEIIANIDKLTFKSIITILNDDACLRRIMQDYQNPKTAFVGLEPSEIVDNNTMLFSKNNVESIFTQKLYEDLIYRNSNESKEFYDMIFWYDNVLWIVEDWEVEYNDLPERFDQYWAYRVQAVPRYIVEYVKVK